MVTVMVVPNIEATAVIINGGDTVNVRATSPVRPSCAVPLTVMVWSPMATEGYTKPSEPITVEAIHRLGESM